MNTIFQTETEVNREVKRFRRYLKKEDMSDNTLNSYCWTLAYFLNNYKQLTSDSILSYKSYLMENFAPSTVNLRIQALNKYFYFSNSKFHIKSIKVQQKPFLDNIISMQDYKYLKKRLKKDNNMDYYFLVWGIACTGARISEALTFKVEHIADGMLDFYGKGKKYRRIYFIRSFQKEALKWLDTENRHTGYVFINKDGNRMTVKGVEKQLKKFARQYQIDESVMYPHSFRHLFGKTFYDIYKDLPLLADIMGHSSLETTRIYSRKTSLEQAKIMNDVIHW